MDETPATHHQLLMQGQAAIHRGAFNEALRCFKAIYDVAPGDIRAADGSGSRGQGKSVGRWGLRLAAHKGLLRAGNLTIDLCPRRW